MAARTPRLGSRVSGLQVPSWHTRTGDCCPMRPLCGRRPRHSKCGKKGDENTLACARFARGLVLVQQESPERRDGFDLLAKAREAALQNRFTMAALPPIDIELAKDKARTDDLDGAIELLRAVVDDEFATGEMAYRGAAVTALVESLLQRGTDADAREAGDRGRVAGRRADRTGIRAVRTAAAAAAGPIGAGARRRARLSGPSRALSGDGDIAWVRRPHGDSRGDDMTPSGLPNTRSRRGRIFLDSACAATMFDTCGVWWKPAISRRFLVIAGE